VTILGILLHPRSTGEFIFQPVRYYVAWCSDMLCACCIVIARTGTVRLASKDPLAAPLVDPNYLDHPDDIKALRNSLMVSRVCALVTDRVLVSAWMVCVLWQLIRKMVKTEAFKKTGANLRALTEEPNFMDKVTKLPRYSDEWWEVYIRWVHHHSIPPLTCLGVLLIHH